MRSHTLASCSVLFVTICCGQSSQSRLLTDGGLRHSDTKDISDHSLYNRQKRAVKIILDGALAGIKAMNTLTQGAKRLPPKGRFREFEKPGSLKQALKDFKKLKMLQQHEFKLPGGGIGIAGKVGDRQFILQSDGAVPLIDVIQIEKDWLRRITTRIYYID